METFFKIKDMTLADADNCADLEKKYSLIHGVKKVLKTHWQLKKMCA